MGIESYDLGKQGEELAERYLAENGYRVIDRNYRSQQGEIDIIAYDGPVLVFLEVKSYSFRSYGPPVGAVRKSKRESIIHAARTYLWKQRIKDTTCRFDVLTIYRQADNKPAVELYKGAFTC